MDKRINPHHNNVVLSTHKYESKHVKIIHNPNTVDSGQQLTVRVPMLGTNECLLANTFQLTFDVTGLIGTLPKNMLVVSMFKEIKYQINGNAIYTLNDVNVHNFYKDIWKSKGDDLYRVGYQNESILKIRHDLAGKDDTKTSDKLIADIYKTRYELELNHVLLDKVFSKTALEDSFEI